MNQRSYAIVAQTLNAPKNEQRTFAVNLVLEDEDDNKERSPISLFQAAFFVIGQYYELSERNYIYRQHWTQNIFYMNLKGPEEDVYIIYQVTVYPASTFFAKCSDVF